MACTISLRCWKGTELANFYKTDEYEQAQQYEIISDERLAENCGGYDTQRIVREVLEYLAHGEGFRIRYNGDSQFLATVAGLERVDLESLARSASMA